MGLPALVPSFVVAAAALLHAPAQQTSPEPLSPLDPANSRSFGYWFELNRAIYNEWLWALKPGSTVPWLTADAGTMQLHEWRGSIVSLLTAKDSYDPILVDRVVRAADRYWTACRDLCGNSPPSDPDVGDVAGGRPLLVEFLDEASGDGPPLVYGQPGIARTSVETVELEALLRGAANGPSRAPLGMRVPQAMARNFFFLDGELGALAPRGELASAFASILAARASERLGWVSPNEDRPLDETLDRYEHDSTLTFDAVFAAPRGETPVEVDTLLLAILVRLQNASGRPDFVERLWRAAAECPPAMTQHDAAANLVVAASGASGADLTARFQSWRFPVSKETKARVKQAIAPMRATVPDSAAEKSKKKK